jgi:hypothetical protein
MRLADTPAPSRASGRSDAVPREGPGSQEGPVSPDEGSPGDDAVFAAAVTALHAGREAASELRDDITFEDCPAPRRLAPHAAAMAAVAYRDGEEVATGRLMLLYDPAGQEGWTGEFRLVTQVHADVDPEMAEDPLLGEVGWSWLTEALDARAPGYSAPSGTVTRVITEGFGAKEDEPTVTGFELRASWCPGDLAELSGSVEAWCDLIVAAAGLPAQPQGTRALRAGRRRHR